MTQDTPLDRAHLAAQAQDAGPDAMARFYALLVETPLMVPITEQPDDQPIAPQVFDLSDGPVALAFDEDARMTGFFEGPVAFVTLPGRSLVAALAEAGLGLGLNLGEAPSALLLDAATVQWIAAEMGGEVETLDLAGALTVLPPHGAPRSLLSALAERVEQLPGLVREAWLVGFEAEDGGAGLALLLLPGTAASRAMPGVVTMLGRTAAVHGAEAGAVTIGVLDEHHRLLSPARRFGHALHPPPPGERPATAAGGKAATTDTPPKLR